MSAKNLERNSKTRTKKNHGHNKKRTKIKELWTIFDTEISNNTDMECLYSKGKIENRSNCDLCGADLRFSDNKFLSCSNKRCGVIYKDVLDQTAEWRYYGSEDNNTSDPTRCGMPINPLLKESSYGCTVVCRSRSTYEMRKIRRYTEWQSMPYKEKAQYDEFVRIQIMASNAGISKIIIDEALRYHKKISEQKTFRGLNRDGIIAASIYIGSRIHGYPRTAKEIATIFHLDNSSATKGCKNAVSILNKIEKGMENDDKTYFYKTQPLAFIDRFCSRLNMNSELTQVSRFVSVRIENKNLMPENTPPAVAAGILYFISIICQLNISKKDIAIISEISEVTINKCHKKLQKHKKYLIPSFVFQKYST